MSNGSVIRKDSISVEPGKLRQFLQVLHSDILEDVDTQLQKGIDRIVLEFEFKQRKPQNGFIKKSSSSKESGTRKELPPKEFVTRNSILTDLWENAEMRSLYNCIFAVFVLLYIYIAIFYYFNIQRMKNDLSLLSWTFSKFQIVAAIWFAVHLSIAFLLYPVFRFWSTNRILMKKKRLYDSIFCTLFILYQSMLLIIPSTVIIVYNLPPISSFVAIMETIRLFMKTYAFVRENITRSLKYKPHQGGDKEDSNDSYSCPNLEKLLYFLFAPTLIYRDHYPRTPHIRWSYVAWNILQIFGCAAASYFPFICFAVNTFSKAGVEPIPLDHFIRILIGSIFGGATVLFLSFYTLFQCCQNSCAEMLRFGDRMFYNDWWNSTSYAEFYRSWNVIVHDFLYFYIYRDMYVVLGRSRTGAMLTVFLISAIIHEYILAICLKFVFPFLFIMFSTLGVIFVFITRRRTSSFWNVFFWVTLFLGWGILNAFYTLEWYARINCPRILDSWLDYIVPRSFYCNVISLAS